MDNLKTNTTGAYMWQPPQQSQLPLLQQSSVPQAPQQPPPPPAQFLGGMQQQPVRRFAGSKNSYNYNQSLAAGLIMGTNSPGVHLMGIGSPSPNGYRKRHLLNTGYGPTGYQPNGKWQVATEKTFTT